MNASYEWLRAFVPFDVPPARLRDLITARAATVDDLVALRADLAPIVVARVVAAERHPDSDHLWVTKVDAGGAEPLDVVCGAPNVTVGTKYPFAPAGTVMPDGKKIERRKIRGALSNGMLCSARELGIGEEQDGILPLAVAAPPGTPFLRAMPVGDTRLVIDVGANRPDLLSHLGIAREIAAALGAPLAFPAFDGDGLAVPAPRRATSEEKAAAVTVRLPDPTLARRYMGVVIRGVGIRPSPEWLVRRLEAVGSRSVNNVVDATNYILHELGQPIHAFDLDKLAGQTVAVRLARAGERLTTLDGVERTLDARASVIADARGAVALAGLMGGRDSEVTDETTAIFLEVANFDPRVTRAMRRALGMSTDAGYRFERGVDVEMTGVALERAVRLIIAVAGGEVDGAPADLRPEPTLRRTLSLRVARVGRILGEAVPRAEIVRLLSSVGFEVAVAPGTEMLTGEEDLVVTAPTWRGDVSREVDLIEEVARLRGYDALPDALRPFRVGTTVDDPMWTTSRRVRDALAAEGLLEAKPLPFVPGRDGEYVRVANPLAEDEAHLRREVLESLTRRAEYNLARAQRSVRLFELGPAFAPAVGPLPREEWRVALVVTGDREPPHFTAKPRSFDEWDAKALAETAARAAWPRETVALEPGAGDVLWRVRADDGYRGAVRRLSLDAPAGAAPAFGVELTLGVVSSAPVAPPGEAKYEAGAPGRDDLRRPYRALPVTPAVERDLALLLPDRVTAADVEALLRRHAGELLEGLTLFDEYRGKNVPAGTRSVAWRLTFRHAERTLRDKELEGRLGKLARALEEELGVRQRTT
jgi:phenylalanyl-tRNA synthetase beta chain